MSTKPQDDPSYPVRKTDAEWRAQLDPMQYQVARHAATERAFTGKYWDHFEPGRYDCVGCGTPLFESDTKFDAGCGWPSYWRADQQRGRSSACVDRSHGMVRVEVRCNHCGSHLGHVFDDGPAADRRALLHQLGRDRLRSLRTEPRRRLAAAGPPTERMKLLFDFLPIILFFARLQVRRGPQGLGRRLRHQPLRLPGRRAAWSAPTRRRCCWPPWW